MLMRVRDSSKSSLLCVDHGRTPKIETKRQSVLLLGMYDITNTSIWQSSLGMFFCGSQRGNMPLRRESVSRASARALLSCEKNLHLQNWLVSISTTWCCNRCVPRMRGNRRNAQLGDIFESANWITSYGFKSLSSYS